MEGIKKEDGNRMKGKRMNSKQKGNAFEREICRRLSLWYSKGKRSDIFWRTATSGGRATSGLKAGKLYRSQVGDVGAVDEVGAEFLSKYILELKHYRNLGLETFVTRGEGLLMRFWEKLCKESVVYGKTPILIAKQNNRPIVVLIADPPASMGTPRAVIFPRASGAMKASLFLFEDIFNERKRISIRPAPNR